MKTTIDYEIKNVFQPQINGINPQNFIENFTGNDLINIYYNKDDGNIIMKKINKLNMNFYMLSERYLKYRNDIDKINDSLFLNLFKQISIYIEEIEKLNLKLKDIGNNIKKYRDNLNELNKENINFKLIIKNLEIQLKEKNNNEIKLKKEIESYKRQVTFYKDKLKLDLDGKQLNNSKINISTSKFINLTKLNTNKQINNSIENEIMKNNYSIDDDDIINSKRNVEKFITGNNKTKKKIGLIKKYRNNNNLKLLNETMNLNSSKLSLKDINDNKSNKKKRNKNLSFSPKPKNKIQLNKDIKKTNHNNHSVQINISNINNNNTINNNTFEKIVKEVNEDYDKNIEILKDQEEQIKFMLRLIKGNKQLNNQKNSTKKVMNKHSKSENKFNK